MTTRRATARVACVFLAAGSGSRMANPINSPNAVNRANLVNLVNRVNKVFLPLAGQLVVLRSIEATRDLPDVSERVLVVAERDMAAAETLFTTDLPFDVRLVRGGSSRHQSEHNAFEELGLQIEDGDIDIVVIHDAARPLALPGLFSDVIQAARGYGGALPVRPAPPLAALTRTDVLEGETDVVTVQTPQAFRARPLLEAYRAAALVGFVGTDTASCIERFTDIRIKGVRGHDANIKLTYAEDLLLAERLLADADRAESAVGQSRVGNQAHG